MSMNLVPSEVLIKIGILNSVLSGNLFGVISKYEPWPDDQSPPVPADVDEEEVFEELLFTKRISPNQVKFLVNREDWEAGTSYSIGDVIITSVNYVYVCTSAGTSTEEPTVDSGSEADGSLEWKFLFRLDAETELIYGGDFEYIPFSWDQEEFFWTNLPVKLRIAFDVVSDEDGKLPYSYDYRIAGLYVNPFNRFSKNNEIDNEDFKTYGSLLGISTFEPKSRTPEQIDVHVFDITLH